MPSTIAPSRVPAPPLKSQVNALRQLLLTGAQVARPYREGPCPQQGPLHGFGQAAQDIHGAVLDGIFVQLQPVPFRVTAYRGSNSESFGINSGSTSKKVCLPA
jgi:hypothetical protein